MWIANLHRRLPRLWMAFCSVSKNEIEQAEKFKLIEREQSKADLALQTDPELAAKLYLEKASAQEVAKIKSQIGSQLDQYDNDEILDTYKDDVSLLFNDKFSQIMKHQDKLLDIREKNEKSEKIAYSMNSGMAALFAGLSIFGLLTLFYHKDRLQIRVPASFNYWYGHWKASRLQGSDKDEYIYQMNKAYIDINSNTPLHNASISLSILSSISSSIDSYRHIEDHSRTIDDVVDNCRLYVKQIDSHRIIDTMTMISWSTASSSVFSNDDKIRIIDKYAKVIDKVIDDDDIDDMSLFDMIDVLSVYESVNARGKNVEKFERVKNEVLKECADKENSQLSLYGQDKAVIKEGLDEFLNKRLLNFI